MAEYMLETRDLGITFGGLKAVQGLNLKIRHKELYGLIGPNGAGKTTTVRLLSSLATIDEGTVLIGGHDLVKEPRVAKSYMGVIQQHISLDKDLTVRENMMQHAMFHKIPKKERNEKIDELVKYVGLEEYQYKMVDSLSGGWKRRVAIVCALFHNPDIIFLDEPTAGLDIQARRLLWDLIRKLNHDGTTVFLTTHYIEEAESLCDRIGIINHGKIITVDTPQNLCEQAGNVAVEYFKKDVSTEYKYFKSREEAKEFADTLSDEYTVLIRKTNLEDCFVMLTGDSVGGQ